MKSFIMYAILLLFLVIIFIKKTRHLSQRVMWSSLSQNQGNFLISDNSGNLTSQSVSSILKNITDNITELRQKVDVISGKLTAVETKSNSNYNSIQDIYRKLGDNITTSNTVRQQLDSKQSAGDYVQRGGYYNLSFTSPQGVPYTIDAWRLNGRSDDIREMNQFYTVKNGEDDPGRPDRRSHRKIRLT